MPEAEREKLGLNYDLCVRGKRLQVGNSYTIEKKEMGVKERGEMGLARGVSEANKMPGVMEAASQHSSAIR